MASDRLRLSKRKAGKRRKLRKDIAAEFEDAFRTLMNGVKPPPLTRVRAPPGVILRSSVQRIRRPDTKERDVADRLEHHAKELLKASADFYGAENSVKMCANCRKRQHALSAESARLHHVLAKILGDDAPAPRPSAI